MSSNGRIGPRIAVATAAVGLMLAAAAPSANAAQVTWIKGFRAPGTKNVHLLAGPEVDAGAVVVVPAAIVLGP